MTLWSSIVCRSDILLYSYIVFPSSLSVPLMIFPSSLSVPLMIFSLIPISTFYDISLIPISNSYDIPHILISNSYDVPLIPISTSYDIPPIPISTSYYQLLIKYYIVIVLKWIKILGDKLFISVLNMSLITFLKEHKLNTDFQIGFASGSRP